MSASTPRAITVAILAMGGEGGGVLADWIVDVAERSGYYAQTTSVPGVAQRTGATIYYIELFPEAAGKDPVLALMPIPGEVDVVIASELMEMGRAIQRGLVTPDRTTLIASTHRVYSMTEKIALGDGRIQSDVLLESGKTAAKRFIHADFAQFAADTSSVISAALFGALAASGSLPFARERYEEAIRAGGIGVESSLAAFNAGFRGTIPVPEPSAQKLPALSLALTQRIERDFPTAARDILITGAARAVDYQDAQYASEYLDRLAPVRSLDSGDFALLRETARYLALWMTYEDAVRVADLKIRRTRFDRVHEESRATSSNLIHIHEYLHPSVQEIADILPRRLGERLLSSREAARFINAYVGNGRIVQTTSLRGFLMLYVLAGQRKRRRKSLRFQREDARIREWLALVQSIAQQDYRLALEVAQLPRLIKGYGDTHQRGMKNYDTLLAALPTLRGRPDAAAILNNLRDAALADDTGKQLADALQAVAA
jgi:indolepyruvate ferredoxin oxidoreductase beta subunit